MFETVLNTPLLFEIKDKQITFLSVEAKKDFIKFSNNFTKMLKIISFRYFLLTQ